MFKHDVSAVCVCVCAESVHRPVFSSSIAWAWLRVGCTFVRSKEKGSDTSIIASYVVEIVRM